MSIEEIKHHLCMYDKRHPDYNEDSKKPNNCYCDNCFYGRHYLAEELLKVKALLTSAVQIVR